VKMLLFIALNHLFKVISIYFLDATLLCRASRNRKDRNH